MEAIDDIMDVCYIQGFGVRLSLCIKCTQSHNIPEEAKYTMEEEQISHNLAIVMICFY